MTLIELLELSLSAGLGAVCGIITGEEGGPMLGVLGAMFGVLLIPVLIFVVTSVAWTLAAWLRWPLCLGCQRDDYVLEIQHGRCVARCCCGALYVRRGQQCLRLLPGGMTRPYMRWRPLSGWSREAAALTAEPRAPYREDHDPAF